MCLLFWRQVEVADDICPDSIDLFCLFLEVCPFFIESWFLLRKLLFLGFQQFEAGQFYISLNGEERASRSLENHQLRFVGRAEGSFVLRTLVGFVHRLEPLVIADVLYEWLYLPQPSLHRDQLGASAIIRTMNILDFSLEISIPEKVILGEIIDGTGSLLEVVDLCPMFIFLAFLSFDAVLDVNDERNSFSLCLHLLLTGIASRDALFEPFFGIILPDGFCTGKPLLPFGSEGDVLARFDFVTGLMHQF